LDVLTYVTLIQTKEEFHQGIGYVKPVVDQNHDNPIPKNEFEVSAGTHGSFSFSFGR